MSGEELAQEIIENFGSKNILTICKKVGVEIRYARWFSSTIGEFDSKNNTITVNLNAIIEHEKIIIHELGHYFIHQKKMKLTRIEEEKVVENFAQFFY